MNALQSEVFKKGCRDLFYGRKNGKETEKLTQDEEILFKKVLSANVHRIRDERKRLIICLRLGIAGFQKETYKVVGELLGITGSRVGQLERKALPELFRTVNPKWRTWIWE
jgi:DNA-directed RNA polymerase sigma subunit (sigma70/sigma32)